MTDVTFEPAIPVLRIYDIAKAKEFYVDFLGFAIDWEHRFEPGMPLFVQISREGQLLFLSEHAGDCEPGGAVYFHVPDVDALYTAFIAGGVAWAGSDSALSATQT